MSKTSDCCKPPTRRPLFWVALAVALVVTAVVTLTGRPAKTPARRCPWSIPSSPELGAAYPIDVIASGVVHEHELVAAPATLSLLDGRSLEVWAYNGQVPGPTFRARVGDTLRVRFKNELPQPTTVHWHGVRVPNSMDGVPVRSSRRSSPAERSPTSSS
ncbi:MAG: multicopper oxidase domain-containing protein [Polyangiaceae bacterium]|nr:multicopper oxidase domain-containing protein [Polyangiaceae bacterium]